MIYTLLGTWTKFVNTESINIKVLYAGWRKECCRSQPAVYLPVIWRKYTFNISYFFIFIVRQFLESTFSVFNFYFFITGTSAGTPFGRTCGKVLLIQFVSFHFNYQIKLQYIETYIFYWLILWVSRTFLNKEQFQSLLKTVLGSDLNMLQKIVKSGVCREAWQKMCKKTMSRC